MSGRRKHPAAPPPAEPLPTLAGRLTEGDWQVCRLLADHQMLTTGLLALLLDASPRTLQQRLTRLTWLRVVERFRPHQPLGAGSAPYHYLLGEAGAAVLATDPATTIDPPGWDRTQLLRLAHANGRLTHLLAVNTLLAQLTHTARHQPGTRLVCWWPADRCQAQWGPLIGPDAYARWQDPGGEVDFFLHHTPAQPISLLEGYDELAAATSITTPVLTAHRRSRPGGPAAELARRSAAAGAGGHHQPDLGVAHRPGVAADQQPCWRPALSARRARPPRPLALHHAHHTAVGGRLAAPTRLKAPPGGGRTHPRNPTHHPPTDPSSTSRRNRT